MNWIINNWELLLSIATGVLALVSGLILLISRLKGLKNAKTKEEREKIVNDIKSDIFGLVSVAEETFNTIDKSGSTKLLYVLKQVEEICKMKGCEFNSEYWTEFINSIIEKANGVKEQKALEKNVNELINELKEEVPGVMEKANRMFLAVPDNKEYKIRYVVKYLENAVKDSGLVVEYDWESYVKELYGG